MPFAVAVEPNLIRITFSGVLTADDLRGAEDDMHRIEDASTPVASRITNLSGVTDLKIAYAEVQALASRRRAIAFPNRFKSAIVVGSPAHLGMARMFQTLNDNPQITIEIFTDEASALGWIRS